MLLFLFLFIFPFCHNGESTFLRMCLYGYVCVLVCALQLHNRSVNMPVNSQQGSYKLRNDVCPFLECVVPMTCPNKWWQLLVICLASFYRGESIDTLCLCVLVMCCFAGVWPQWPPVCVSVELAHVTSRRLVNLRAGDLPLCHPQTVTVYMDRWSSAEFVCSVFQKLVRIKSADFDTRYVFLQHGFSVLNLTPALILPLNKK